LNPKIPIYVDQRENTDLIKEIYSIDELEVHSKQLDVGDIVITENIAIERKAKIDFVNSIIDKRLFPQLMDLARNFRRPILILEGEENIYTLRNLNPNVIRATLSAIAVDLRIPIIVTNNMQETAQMIRTIAKRTKKDKKEISLVSDKKSHSENEEMEKFVSSIPKINVVNAKGLLSHFKSLKDLINASEKELLEVQGIGPGRAKFLREFFEREYQL
ncbi:MAG: ERCC4 domain-containing protein, partial [Nanoarchaeota archaeon]|nr:ERCC4 domain-containing protein [Nanoarchaeota archaeon]